MSRHPLFTPRYTMFSMPRPRRPALVTACAVLLLATVTVWVMSYFRRDSIVWDRPSGYQWGIGYGLGEAVVSRSGPWLQWPATGLHHHAQDADLADARKFHPLWFNVTRWDVGDSATPPRYLAYSASAPMWVVAAIPAAGLWWSWRGRKAGVGFPVGTRAAE
jgi:hypothetical protein